MKEPIKYIHHTLGWEAIQSKSDDIRVTPEMLIGKFDIWDNRGEIVNNTRILPKQLLDLGFTPVYIEDKPVEVKDWIEDVVNDVTDAEYKSMSYNNTSLLSIYIREAIEKHMPQQLKPLDVDKCAGEIMDNIPVPIEGQMQWSKILENTKKVLQQYSIPVSQEPVEVATQTVDEIVDNLMDLVYDYHYKEEVSDKQTKDNIKQLLSQYNIGENKQFSRNDIYKWMQSVGRGSHIYKGVCIDIIQFLKDHNMLKDE